MGSCYFFHERSLVLSGFKVCLYTFWQIFLVVIFISFFLYGYFPLIPSQFSLEKVVVYLFCCSFQVLFFFRLRSCMHLILFVHN